MMVLSCSKKDGAGGGARRRSWWRRGAAWTAVVVAVMFVVPTVLVLVADRPVVWGPEPDASQARGGSSGGAGAAAVVEGFDVVPVDEELTTFWRQLRDPLSMGSDVPPAADWLFGSGVDGVRPAKVPRGVAQAVDAAFGADWGRIPVPPEPQGSEPLLAALRSFTDTIGLELPSADVLRAEIAALRMQPETERAVARLVNAYVEALAWEERALRDLSPSERLLVQGDVPAAAAWIGERPGRTWADYEALVAEELVPRIDLMDRVRAADMLVRTYEAVEDALVLPAAPLVEEAVPSPVPDAQDAAPEVSEASSSEVADAPSWDDVPQWERVMRLVALPAGQAPSELPPLPQEHLAEALFKLGWVLGVHPADAKLPQVDLPPSLADAAAQIVTARRVGLLSGDATLHASLMVDATRRTEPTLRAWAAVSEMYESQPGFQSDPQAFFSEALRPGASPSRLLSYHAGHEPPEPAAEPPHLATLLRRHGVSGTDASHAASALSAPAAAAVATALEGLDGLAAARDRALGPLNATERDLVERTPEILRLWKQTRWTAEQADFVASWARAMRSLYEADGVRELERAQADAVRAVEDTVAIIKEAGPDLVPAVFTPMSAHGSLPLGTDCPNALEASGLSDCDNDVWLFLPEAGLLVTGFRSSTVGNLHFGQARLILDLGGDDTYLVAAGAARNGAGVVVDVQGDDVYRSAHDVAQGAARGLGALGVLWDMDGDDVYEIVPGDFPDTRLAHGAGADGGVGVLVDEVGSDEYSGTPADAQGSGRGSVAGAGRGILLDRSTGADTFLADRGQGFAAGTGSLGLLVNEQGRGFYDTFTGNDQYQGGHREGESATGALIDLGGAGTFYSNGDLPDGATFHAAEGREALRGDDALWVVRSVGGVGLGIDSTLEDEDDDGFANLVELVAGSDPEDGSPDGQPGNDTVERALDLLTGLIGEPPDPDDVVGDPTGELVSFDDGGFGGLFCRTDTSPCEDKMSVLRINGTRDDDIREPAHILIDLGGDDTYHDEVAGPGHFYLDGERRHGVGSFALDLGGDDHYATPDLSATQGAVDVPLLGSFTPAPPPGEMPSPTNSDNTGCIRIGLPGPTQCAEFLAAMAGWSAANLPPWANENVDRATGFALSSAAVPPVSLLVDVAGNDWYEADEHSQGAAFSDAGHPNDPGWCNALVSGAAWLIDMVGDDEYVGSLHSQGAARDNGGVGGLADLSGGDEYTFAKQGSSEDTSGGDVTNPCVRRVGLVFDGGGRDTYNSTAVPVDTNDVTREEPGDAFKTQGVGEVDLGAATSAPVGVGVFVDHGASIDRYVTLNTDGAFVEIGHIKNDVTRGPQDGSFFSDGLLWPVDPLVADDPDDDGSTTLLERLFGTDQRDADENEGSVWTAPERVGENASQDPAGMGPDGLVAASGLDDDRFWLWLPGLLAIGGREDKVLTDSPHLVVSLGGDNTYVGSRVGGAGALSTSTGVGQGVGRLVGGAVTFLVDAGDGDTEYRPDADGCRTVATGSTRLCPSLGGAVQGSAVVIDGGGSNVFDVEARVDIPESETLESVGPYELVTQGAAVGNSVGMLVTSNASSTFGARLSAFVPQATDVEMDGVVHGAVRGGGLGLLASLGPKDDVYEVSLERHEIDSDGPDSGSATSRSVAQGSAEGADSVGILLDEGGSNRFSAPDGFAHGFGGDEGVGLLFSGSGDDQFIGRAASQGTGVRGGIGLLHDAGGNDEYLSLAGTHALLGVTGMRESSPGETWPPELGSLAFSQGAALGGFGFLVDEWGDDRYLAPDNSRVQGAGVTGTGILLDLGGHDVYHARDRAQGYVSHSAEFTNAALFQASAGFLLADTPPLGLLLDLQGRDVYDVVDGMGQGLAEMPEADDRAARCMQTGNTAVGRSSVIHRGLFVDAGGTDSYTEGGWKVAVAGMQGADGNNWAWTQGVPEEEDGGPVFESLCAFGVGVDDRSMDVVVQTLRTVAVPFGVRSVSLQAWASDQVIPNGGTVEADVRFEVGVRVDPPEPERVRRVAIVSDGGVLGHASFVGVMGSSLRYEFTWDTSSKDVADGAYDVRASAFFEAAPDEAAGVHHDLPAVESSAVRLNVDNPPLLDVSFDESFPDAMVPGGPSEGPPSIRVTVGEDIKAPSNAPDPPACGDTDEDWAPGGDLLVRGVAEDGTEKLAFAGYCAAGTFDVPVSARTPGGDDEQNWPDGLYDILVRLTDVGKRETEKPGPTLLVDGTGPVSSITTPSFAGIPHRGQSSLIVAWDHTDFEGAGVARACLFQLDRPEGNLVDGSPECFAAAQTQLRLPGVQTGDELHFLVAAVDLLGNMESVCQDGETPEGAVEVCYLAKADDPDNVATVQVDFDPPSIGDVKVSGEPPSEVSVRPGAPVTFTAVVAEAGTGLDRVTIQLPGGVTAEMLDDGFGTYRYTQWHRHNGDLHAGEPREESFTFRVAAVDRADNAVTQDHVGLLDSLPPRLTPQETLYRRPGSDASLAAGLPSGTAVLRVAAFDAAMKTLTAHTADVATTDEVACQPEDGAAGSAAWECAIQLKTDVEDGDYGIPLTAVDAAGNKNEAVSALVKIRGTPLELADIEIVSVDHDGFVVEWATEFPGTSKVSFGRTATLGQTTGTTSEFTEEHRIVVSGLDPSTTYHFRVESESESGVVTRSGDFTVETLNAYEFEFAESTFVGPIRGEHMFDFSLESLTDAGPIQVKVRVQDAGSEASPVDVTVLEGGDGDGNVTVDTTAFADGDYVLVFDLDRFGDFLRVQSPVFRIDNTPPVILTTSPRPASTTAEERPTFEAALLDPMGTAPPLLESLRVMRGDEELSIDVHEDVVGGPSSPQRVITFSLVDALGHGPQVIEFFVADEAGNVGTTELAFAVDTRPPEVEDAVVAEPLPGPEAARPGGYVRIAAELSDGSGVAGASVNLSAVGGGTAPLLSADGVHWQAEVPLPLDVVDGTVSLPVVATDSLGNTGTVETVTVSIDSSPPVILDANVVSRDYTGATLAVRTDTPTLGRVAGQPGPSTDDASAWGVRHDLRVEHLRPGTNYTVTVVATDKAGLEATADLEFETIADVEPPAWGDDASLGVTSPDEGVVLVTWDPAVDDAGLDHYRLERGEAARSPPIDVRIDADQTLFRDVSAPAGRSVGYRLVAVDIAGNEASLASSEVAVKAEPHLTDARFSPDRGTSSDVFTFSVTYWHAGNVAPDNVTVAVGDRAFPMRQAEEARACFNGCTYEANARLPPSSIVRGDDVLVFQVRVGGQHDAVELSKVPFVARDPSDGAVRDAVLGDGEEIASTSLVASLVAVVGALAWAARRRRDGV